MLKFLCGSETFVKIVIIVVHLPFAMVILLMSVMFLIDTKQICTEIAWFFFKSLIILLVLEALLTVSIPEDSPFPSDK